MLSKEEDINTVFESNYGLLAFMLDESAIFALLDAGFRTLWIREDSEFSVGADFREIYDTTIKSGKYFSRVDNKCFTIDDIPGTGFKFVKTEVQNSPNGEIKGLAHDFNNIFSGLLNHLDTLKEKFANDKETFKVLDIMEKNSLRATEILEKALSKNESVKHHKQKVKPEIVFDEVLEVIRHKLPKNFKLMKEITYEDTINLHRSHLFRILLNLISNAVEAINNNNSVLIFRVYKDISNKINIELEDNGRGIDPENIKKIFTKGFSTKNKRLESGIGLHVTKLLVEEEGGEISVTSSPGKGSLFNIKYPPPRKFCKNDTKREKVILIADDESDMRELLAELFSDYNYKVIEANDGIEAYELFVTNPEIELVILDKIMPNLDGIKSAEKIRAIDNETPIIIASGSLKDSEKSLLALMNINRILKKPYKFDELLEITEELVNA